MDTNVDLSRLSREQLLEEIAKRDDTIITLKQEVQRFQQLFHARKIAVSAETDSKSSRLIIHKDQKTRDIIESAFLVNEFLCQLEESQMEDIIQSMYHLDAPAESMIIRQGEHGSQLFKAGYKLQRTINSSVSWKRLVSLENWPFFIIVSELLQSKVGTLSALTPCRVWAIERKIFHSINVSAAKSKHTSIHSALKRCRSFSNFPDNCLHLIADLATEEQWKHRTEVPANQLVGRIFLIAKGTIADQCDSHQKSHDFLDVLVLVHCDVNWERLTRAATFALINADHRCHCLRTT
uniref:Cyclic nucleotide-binding domain-containing protein n=1 Tax=Panagrellus redivivus TaxID=6233 RepID=A0A7E4W7K4_PANRE